MAAITFAAALLLLVSGGMKVRSGMRVGVGFSPLALVEVVAGFLFLAGALPGALAAVFPRWALPLGIVLIFASTGEHWLRLKRGREFRERSEAGRLRAFLKVNASPDEPDGGTSRTP